MEKFDLWGFPVKLHASVKELRVIERPMETLWGDVKKFARKAWKKVKFWDYPKPTLLNAYVKPYDMFSAVDIKIMRGSQVIACCQAIDVWAKFGEIPYMGMKGPEDKFYVKVLGYTFAQSFLCEFGDEENPFDNLKEPVDLVAVAPYGYARVAKMELKGLKLKEYNTGFGIDDMSIEETLLFEAKEVVPFKQVTETKS